jgi:hypothetical protein
VIRFNPIEQPLTARESFRLTTWQLHNRRQFFQRRESPARLKRFIKLHRATQAALVAAAQAQRALKDRERATVVFDVERVHGPNAYPHLWSANYVIDFACLRYFCGGVNEAAAKIGFEAGEKIAALIVERFRTHYVGGFK